PPHGLYRNGFHDRSRGSDTTSWHARRRRCALRSSSRRARFPRDACPRTAATGCAEVIAGSVVASDQSSEDASKQPVLVAFQTAHLVVIQCQATDSTINGQGASLRFDLLGSKHPADRRQQAVPVEQFEVAGQ